MDTRTAALVPIVLLVTNSIILSDTQGNIADSHWIATGASLVTTGYITDTFYSNFY